MKLTTSILLMAMTAGPAWAQNPANILQNTKNSLNSAEQKKVEQENAALDSTPSKPAAKPSPATPAPKPSPTAVQPAAPAPQVAPAVSKPAATPSASKNTAASAAPKKAEPTRISIAPVTPQPPQGSQKVKPVAQHKAAKPARDPMKAVATSETPKADTEAPKTETAEQKTATDTSGDSVKKDKTITAEGRRDPFLSPVVSRSTGPNCSTGKRCLAIDQIMVRGVVKAESGMIAVVVNSLNKAYFLKENDPVYNGYVVRITGDSVVFKETFQDRLGKEATREVVKKITTPAV